jgi:hypothetical protein
MNSFYEHHKASIRFCYRCFDRILLNGLIQPFQQPERVVGFFNTYRGACKTSERVGLRLCLHTTIHCCRSLADLASRFFEPIFFAGRYL